MADLAYVMIGYLESSQNGPNFHFERLRYSEWDHDWVQRLTQHLPTIPHLDRLFQQGIDAPWIQMENMPEAEFQRTDFYRNWVKPQKLRDGMSTLFVDRKVVKGVMVMTQREGKPLLGDRERRLANLISPHVRRAIAINELVDKGRLALSLYRKVLDSLSVAVFIAGRGEQQPMAIEILRTVFDLTPMEAKIAYATSLGDNPEAIALALGNWVETIRSHQLNASGEPTKIWVGRPCCKSSHSFNACYRAFWDWRSTPAVGEANPRHLLRPPIIQFRERFRDCLLQVWCCKTTAAVQYRFQPMQRQSMSPRALQAAQHTRLQSYRSRQAKPVRLPMAAERRLPMLQTSV